MAVKPTKWWFIVWTTFRDNNATSVEIESYDIFPGEGGAQTEDLFAAVSFPKALYPTKKHLPRQHTEIPIFPNLKR